jgi:hypothetical protein
MASHKGWDRVYPVGSVATSGGSFFLGKGQLALIDLAAVPTTAGLKIVDSVSGLSKDRQFQLRIGKHDIKNNRSQSSKDWSTETFKISNILKLEVDAPKSGIGVDEMVIGYDGFNDDSAIVLQNGDNEEIGIALCGEVIGALGYHQAEVEIKTYLEAPNEGTFTNHEIVERAVDHLNGVKLMGDVPITNYVEFLAVNDENTALTGTDSVFYNLTVEDNGDSNALAAIQSQYNVQVVRSGRVGAESTYTIIGSVGATITTTNFVVGKQYRILVVGDTDFIGIGASADEVGIIFTATGVGDGTTGTASGMDIVDFTKNPAWKVKGCADCPTGYSAFTDGWIYSVQLEDDGADSTAAVEAISTNAEANSAVSVSQIDGVSTYTFINSAALTDAEIAAFVVTNPEARIELVAEDVTSICNPDNSTAYTWLYGEICKVQTQEYYIILADDECGSTKEVALAAAFPELTSVAVDSSANCMTKYTADQVTNVVCDNCDDAFRALFSSEVPGDYDSKPWMKTAPTYSATAKMGIKVKAKQIILAGSEVYRDDMPFFATSARIRPAGGYITNVSESFNTGRIGRIAVTILSIATEPENWGANLREFEDITKRYEEGVSRHEGNNYGKWILGEETLLDATTPYVDYILTVKLDKYAQSFSGNVQETFNYHFLAPLGVHVGVENILNTLALAADVTPVQAYAKD